MFIWFGPQHKKQSDCYLIIKTAFYVLADQRPFVNSLEARCRVVASTNSRRVSNATYNLAVLADPAELKVGR